MLLSKKNPITLRLSRLPKKITPTATRKRKARRTSSMPSSVGIQNALADVFAWHNGTGLKPDFSDCSEIELHLMLIYVLKQG